MQRVCAVCGKTPVIYYGAGKRFCKNHRAEALARLTTFTNARIATAIARNYPEGVGCNRPAFLPSNTNIHRQHKRN